MNIPAIGGNRSGTTAGEGWVELEIAVATVGRQEDAVVTRGVEGVHLAGDELQAEGADLGEGVEEGGEDPSRAAVEALEHAVVLGQGVEGAGRRVGEEPVEGVAVGAL